jgi:hypothetical protein
MRGWSFPTVSLVSLTRWGCCKSLQMISYSCSVDRKSAHIVQRGGKAATHPNDHGLPRGRRRGLMVLLLLWSGYWGSVRVRSHLEKQSERVGAEVSDEKDERVVWRGAMSETSRQAAVVSLLRLNRP